MKPTLYIIIRSDVPDMNPGKGMAQASHVTNDFMANCSSPYIREWMEDRNFGTVLVLSGTIDDIIAITGMDSDTGITIDDTYPWRNWYGKLHLTKEITGGWAFVHHESTKALTDYLQTLTLHE